LFLVFISDGKPSDTLPEHKELRLDIVARIAQMLQVKLTVFGMGIGACGSDFEQLQILVEKAKEQGAEGQFIHAGLNPANLSTTFSSIATSMTTTRNELSMTGEIVKKTEKNYLMRQKKQDDVHFATRKETKSVCRYEYDNDVWKKVDFLYHDSSGFVVKKSPFGKVSRGSI
jgi:hypothetical protein